MNDDKTLTKEDIAFLRKVAKGGYFGCNVVFRVSNNGDVTAQASLRATMPDGCEITGEREIPVLAAHIVDYDKHNLPMAPSASLNRAWWSISYEQVNLLLRIVREGDALVLQFIRGAATDRVHAAGFAVDAFRLIVRSPKRPDLLVISDTEIESPEFRHVRY